MPKYDALLRYGPPHLAWKDDTQRQMRSIRPYVLPEKQPEHDVDPPFSDPIGLKSGGAIKSALRIARRYANGGGINPDQYTTPLAADDIADYNRWKQQYAPHDSGYDYDLQGAYKAGFTPDPVTGHFDDRFKKPNHPTFSIYSQYAKDRPDLAGTWNGSQYIPPVTAHYAKGGVIKVSKSLVNYSKGMPKSHCGICRFYQSGLCIKVQGKIDPAYWCRLFRKKD